MDPDPVARLAALPGVGAAAASARDAIDAVVSERGRRRVGADVVAEALLLGALGSAVCDDTGNADRPAGTVLEQVETLRAAVGTVDDSTPSAVRARALARSYTELPALAAGTAITPLQAWTRLHQRLAAGSLDERDLGRVRATDERAQDGSPGVDAAAAWGRVRDLAATVAAGTRAPGVVLAALVHAELATVRPFVAGNDALARAAERLVLMTAGVDPTGLTVPELAYAESPGARIDALAAYASGTGTGTAAWLRYVCSVHTRGAELSPAGRAGV